MTSGHQSVQAFIWALCLIAGSAFAQSSLPACQDSDVARWTNCFGTTTYFISGDKYVGEFKDGKRNGQGTMTFANGNKYVGEWRDNNLAGLGTYTFATGNEYLWGFSEGNRSNQGKYTFTIGDKYVGEFKDGARHGQGIRYSPNGSVIVQGRWENGSLVQSFAIDAQRFPFNSSLTASATQAPAPDPGKAERDRLAATAQSQLPECSSAIFRHNCFDTQIFPNGAKYVGEFKSDKHNGQGIAYTSSGSIVSQGRWENGNLVQSFAIDSQRFPFNSPLTASSTQAPAPDPLKAERDRLTAEVEAERRKRVELQAELDRAKELAESRLAEQQRPQAVQRTEHRVALVIGNAAYKVNPLKNPVWYSPKSVDKYDVKTEMEKSKCRERNTPSSSKTRRSSKSSTRDTRLSM